MKFAYTMMVLLLFGALALPFFMKGPNGQPIVTVDDMVGEGVVSSVSDLMPAVELGRGEPLEMYSWQDEHGVWQFGERAPDQFIAAMLTVDDSRTTTMGIEWNLIDDVAGSHPSTINRFNPLNPIDPVDFKMPNTLLDTYGAAPKLMGATQRAADALNSRQLGLDEMLDELNAKYRN